MPLLRKIIQVGDAKAIAIPQSYIKYWELKGKEIKKVGLEVNKKIVILPIFEDIEPESEEKHITDIESNIDSFLKEKSKHDL